MWPGPGKRRSVCVVIVADKKRAEGGGGDGGGSKGGDSKAADCGACINCLDKVKFGGAHASRPS